MKQSNFVTRILFLSLFLSAPFAYSANIIFDLGDVLLETKYLQSVLNIGPIKMMSYALTLQNPFACHKKLFQFLDTIKPRNPHEALARDHHGTLLPQLMCDWLKGTISHTEILALIDANADKFDNWIERLLVRALAKTIFTPESFAATRYLVPEGANLVKECKVAGHQIYILSNWDPASFTILQETHPEFFNLFDGIVISGDVGLLKPNPAIYQYLLNTYNLAPDECIFIDDRPENIATGQSLGMMGILYTKKQGLLFAAPDFETVREKINAFEELKYFPIPVYQNGYYEQCQ